MSALSVDVIYAANLKAGDLYAGTVDRNAPTRPVQPCARALMLTDVTTVQLKEVTLVQPVSVAGKLTPLRAEAWR